MATLETQGAAEQLEAAKAPVAQRHNEEVEPPAADNITPLTVARAQVPAGVPSKATEDATSEPETARQAASTVSPFKAPPPSSGVDATALAAGLELAKATHANLQDMIKVADAKAGALVGIQALALALFMGEAYARLANGWNNPGAAGWIVAITSTFSFLAFGLSIICALLVLYPRIRRNEPRPPGARGLLWIDDLLGLIDSPADYVRALHKTEEPDLLADFAFENLKISGILKSKFRGLQPAVWLLKLGVVALMVSLVATFVVGRTKSARQELNQSAARESLSDRSAGNAPSAPGSSQVGVVPASALQDQASPKGGR